MELLDGLKRETITNRDPSEECDWCGQKPRTLYEYGGDGRYVFCNRDCYKSFWGK